METFVFDLYNTLIDVKTNEHTAKAWKPVVDFFGKHGMRADARRLCYEYDRYWKLFEQRAKAEGRFLYPECDCVLQFESIARSVGGKLSKADATTALKTFRLASREHLYAFDGAIELLKDLKSAGKNVYLLSNAQSAFTYDEMNECGLDGLFDGMLISSECGCRKPDPAFFEMLFDKYDIDKSTAVMVGDDRVNDVSGAERFGIAAVWTPNGAAAHRAELWELV